jgi:hypothetical protein
MLIYIISLTLQSTMEITIDNQCSNIRLTSPVYFIGDATCRILFPQQVNSKSITKANFRASMDSGTFCGVLLYRLQGKEDTTTSTQLLVIWRYEFDWLYSCMLLIEHESTLVWDKDKLKMLYDGYCSQYEAYPNVGWKTWLLDDNTKLEIERKSSHGGFEMEIIVSEDDPDLFSLHKPLWIDPDR